MRKAQQRRKQSGAMEKEKTGMLSNAVLKNIAYITMFIDHFFAVVYYTLVRQLQTAGYVVGNEEIYAAGRAVGRIAFILFAYLAVEGFQHTKSRKAYLLRLGIFAFVSEIPFDLAFSEVCFNKESQNVFFTLLIGVLVLTVFAWVEQKADGLRMSVDSRGRGTITSVAGFIRGGYSGGFAGVSGGLRTADRLSVYGRAADLCFLPDQREESARAGGGGRLCDAVWHMGCELS